MDQWGRFEEYVGRLMEQEQIAGAAVAVSRHGELLYEKGFGLRDLETKEPVSPDTVFGIASITKSFTALAIMQLEEAGVLSVDDPVTDYLPEFSLAALQDPSRVRIRHLLSHTTGLAPIFRREELCKLNDHLSYVAEEEHLCLGEPGEYFSYCNDTFLLLGLIVERVTGKLFRRHMTSELLDRLEMNRSTFSLEEVARLSDVSVPYVKKAGGGWEKVAWPVLGNYEVGGGIRSNVRDLLTYGELYVNGGSCRGSRLVRPETLARMWQPVHQIGRKTSYGYALTTTRDYVGRTLVEHGGGQPGVSSHFGFVPEEGLVAVVLTNVANVPVRNIWLAAIHQVLGLPPEHREKEPRYPATSEELSRFVGTYTSAEGGHLRIYLEEGAPVAEIEGQPVSLRASDPRTLVMEPMELPLPFFWKTGEKAWAVRFGSRMLTRASEK
ncbi:beta-lactamase family protein [Brevibacillus ruminantium]|uniref:Beta-lactamase family protein n=1 Tax=Brevibacillus ruminantium TaxID=2950604 RepID=A0ABY4WMN8_9BACL|nr:serine hydrolase domain-containing protein [Brevibacillus ruminantium]USG68362.1 beta-lactamase family protein [Brevibacillus ruminantium]